MGDKIVKKDYELPLLEVISTMQSDIITSSSEEDGIVTPEHKW